MFLTLTTAASLSGAYGIYRGVINPLIEGDLPGPGINTPNNVVLPQPEESRRIAQRYLASQPWAANAKYQLRTAEAFVYFEEWERIDDDRAVRFTPFAMVWQQEGADPDEEPISIISQTAYVKFLSTFEITNNPGRVISAALNGEVTILGADGLEVHGRNFTYSESAMRIWSDNDVRFAQGPHRGEARGVQIELTPHEHLEPNDSIAASGVKSLRLRRDVRMNLVSEPNEEEVAEGKEPTHVTVESDGSFDFFTETNIAIFEKNVRVNRPTSETLSDSLECEKLTLVFEPEPEKDAATPPADTPEPAQKPDRFGMVEDNLTFQRMRAEGPDVVLVSQENDLTAHMHSLVYDAQSRVAALTHSEAVNVVQEQNDLHSPEVTLVHDEEGSVTSFVCRGAGQLNHRDPETGELVLAAKWNKQLRKYPEKNTGLEIIELEQQALLKQPAEDSAISAEFIRMWLLPSPETNDDNTGDNADEEETNPKAKTGLAGRAGNMVPQRALATENVVLLSPELQAKTERLEVWFEDGSLPAASPSPQETPEAAASRDSSKTPASSRVARQKKRSGLIRTAGRTRGSRRRHSLVSAMASVEDPFIPSEETSDDGSPEKTEAAPRLLPDLPGTTKNTEAPEATDEEKKEPVDVSADLIRVRVLRGEKNESSQVAEVWTSGHVKVRRQRKEGEEPLRLKGDRLHLINQAENAELLHVYGSPAHIYDKGLHIEGEEIHLDRAKNLIWVEGKGLLELPVDKTLEGEPLPEPQMLDIWWKERMEFDGKTAKFYEDVRTILEDNRMSCQEMQIELTEAVSFSEEPKGKRNKQGKPDNVDVHRIHCQDGVRFDSYEYEEDKLVGIRRAEFWKFSLDQLTGNMEANGPGWILSWARGSGRRAALAPNRTVKANTGGKSKSSKWEYTRIDFAGKTLGNIKGKHTTFHDRVEIVYGPVDKPLEIIDAEHLPKNGGWMRSNRLHVIQSEKTETAPAYNVVVASGNAELEGRTFHARADSITYDESKELYVLRSIGSRKATIWRQTTLGGKLSRADAQRMDFIPSRNILKFDRTTGLDGSQ
jgi:hypothetical protein